MSKKNATFVNIEEVIKRARRKCGASSDKNFADVLGISKENFSNRKRRGTLLPLIIEWAVNEQVNLQWLVTGESYTDDIGKSDPDPEISDLIDKARRVLTSGNPVAFDALERNIRYFDHAIAAEKRADQAEKKISEMEEDVKMIKAELIRIKREKLRIDMEAEEQSLKKKAG